MGITIIYLQDIGDEEVRITAESIGEKGEAEILARQVIEGMLFLDKVHYSDGSGIVKNPASPLIQ